MSENKNKYNATVEENTARMTLDEAAGLSYMTPEMASFQKKGEFPSLTLKGEDGETEHERVWLHRVFPFDLSEEFISVQTKDGEELGIIRRLSDFSDDVADILREELARKYFVPKIKRIISLKERRGFSYWRVETDIGEMEMSLQDTYRSITRIGGDRACHWLVGRIQCVGLYSWYDRYCLDLRRDCPEDYSKDNA